MLSDDASRDDTVALVRSELDGFNAGREETITLVVRENKTALGATKTFEQAMSLCTSDLVALCDQVDVWAPHKLERMAGELKARPDLTLLHANLTLRKRTRESPLVIHIFGALQV